MTNNNNNNNKEEFCAACLAVPMALAGAGAAGYGSKGNGDHKKMKKIMLWGGLAITLISIVVALYFLFRCKDCG